MTFAATANAICYSGASPVFLDVSRETWNIDPDLLEEELRVAGPRATGRPRRWSPSISTASAPTTRRIEAICERYGVPLIEDAAEGLGATYGSRKAGAFGDCAAFSFNGNKIITTSGGGMLVSRNVATSSSGRVTSRLRRASRPPHYEHEDIGYNYRLSNLLAAVGRGQLAGSTRRLRGAARSNAFYRAALAELPGLDVHARGAVRPLERLADLHHHRPRGLRRRPRDRPAAPRAGISSRGRCGSRCTCSPSSSDCDVRGAAVAEDLFKDGLCLPSGSSLTAGPAADRDCVHRGSPLGDPDRPRGRRWEREAMTMPNSSFEVPPRAGPSACSWRWSLLANIAAFVLRFDGIPPAWAIAVLRADAALAAGRSAG